MRPLIVNVALTGCLFGKEDNPNLPLTPREIEKTVWDCHVLGATVFHIHARDEEGAPTWRKERYQEIVNLIRAGIGPDVIICVSTSGRHWQEYEKRAEVLDCAGVDLASLTLGSFNFPSGPTINAPQMIERLLARMEERGVKPELEAFDVGQIDYALYLCAKGFFKMPYYVNLFFGNRGTMRAGRATFQFAVSELELPTAVIWSAAGIGRYQFEVNCWAIAHGGHVRVGLEDNPKGWESNVEHVRAVVEVARAMGRQIATAKEAREMLCLG